MTIFDTLDQLETYLPIHHKLEHVITIMDRSLPYEKADGSYACDGDEAVSYTVSSQMTGPKGIEFTVREGTLALLVALEGEEILADGNAKSVFIMSEGRFALLGPGLWRRAVATVAPSWCKDVVFTITE